MGVVVDDDATCCSGGMTEQYSIGLLGFGERCAIGDGISILYDWFGSIADATSIPAAVAVSPALVEVI